MPEKDNNRGIAGEDRPWLGPGVARHEDQGEQDIRFTRRIIRYLTEKKATLEQDGGMEWDMIRRGKTNMEDGGVWGGCVRMC